MSSSSPTKPLTDRDVNTSGPSPTKTNTTTTSSAGTDPEKDMKSMDYHRQVLKDKLAENDGSQQTYVSPSDTIMSPCTAKLSAYKSKHFSKAKPQSLFAKLDASRKLGEGVGRKAAEEGAAGKGEER